MLLFRAAWPVKEWVEGIQLFIHWHSLFSEVVSQGGLCLWAQAVIWQGCCQGMKPLTCDAVCLSQTFMLGKRRHLGCQGEPEVSTWWDWGFKTLKDMTRLRVSGGEHGSVSPCNDKQVASRHGGSERGLAVLVQKTCNKVTSAVKKRGEFTVCVLTSRRKGVNSM